MPGLWVPCRDTETSAQCGPQASAPLGGDPHLLCQRDSPGGDFGDAYLFEMRGAPIGETFPGLRRGEPGSRMGNRLGLVGGMLGLSSGDTSFLK